MKNLTLFLVLALFLFFSTRAYGGDIIAILEGQFPEITVKLDPVRGILTIDATPEEHEEIKRILGGIDAPTPQISIEARFVELAVTELGEMRVDLEALIAVDGELVEILWGDTPPELPWLGGGIRLRDPDELTAVLRALEREGEAEIISAPRVTTLNNQEAIIDLMTSIPYVYEITEKEVTREIEPDVEITWDEITWHIRDEEEGVKLRVTPSVTLGETLIALHIEPTVRVLDRRVPVFSLIRGGEEYIYLHWPIIDERAATTQMIVESGETVILGGMIDSTKRAEWGRVPLLGDIPILGHLFRFQEHVDERIKLLIFLTPYILSPTGEKIVAAR